jgi:hypothetical protein
MSRKGGVSEERVKELVKLEIMEMLKPGGLLAELSKAPLVVMPNGGGGGSRRDDDDRDDNLPPVDKLADAMTKDGLGPLALEYSKRVEVGMSHDLALVMSQIDQGFDLTPEGFDIDPIQGSYFNANLGMGDAFYARFRGQFVEKVKAGKSRDQAYEEICGEMGVNAKRKKGAFTRIFDELPAVAGGGFTKSLMEAQRDLERDNSRLLLSSGGSLGGGVIDLDDDE